MALRQIGERVYALTCDGCNIDLGSEVVAPMDLSEAELVGWLARRREKIKTNCLDCQVDYRAARDQEG